MDIMPTINVICSNKTMIKQTVETLTEQLKRKAQLPGMVVSAISPEESLLARIQWLCITNNGWQSIITGADEDKKVILEDSLPVTTSAYEPETLGSVFQPLLVEEESVPKAVSYIFLVLLFYIVFMFVMLARSCNWSNGQCTQFLSLYCDDACWEEEELIAFLESQPQIHTSSNILDGERRDSHGNQCDGAMTTTVTLQTKRGCWAALWNCGDATAATYHQTIINRDPDPLPLNKNALYEHIVDINGNESESIEIKSCLPLLHNTVATELVLINNKDQEVNHNRMKCQEIKLDIKTGTIDNNVFDGNSITPTDSLKISDKFLTPKEIKCFSPIGTTGHGFVKTADKGVSKCSMFAFMPPFAMERGGGGAISVV